MKHERLIINNLSEAARQAYTNENSARYTEVKERTLELESTGSDLSLEEFKSPYGEDEAIIHAITTHMEQTGENIFELANRLTSETKFAPQEIFGDKIAHIPVENTDWEGFFLDLSVRIISHELRASDWAWSTKLLDKAWPMDY